jgi:hypothetical protein
MKIFKQFISHFRISWIYVVFFFLAFVVFYNTQYNGLTPYQTYYMSASFIVTSLAYYLIKVVYSIMTTTFEKFLPKVSQKEERC